MEELKNMNGYLRLAKVIIQDAVDKYTIANKKLSDDYKKFYIEYFIKKTKEKDDKEYKMEWKEWENRPIGLRGKMPKSKIRNYEKLANESYDTIAFTYNNIMNETKMFLDSNLLTIYSCGKIHKDWIYKNVDRMLKLNTKNMIKFYKMEKQASIEYAICLFNESISIVLDN